VRPVAFVLYGITLFVSHTTVLENDGPSFETTITFIGGSGERGGGVRERDGWIRYTIFIKLCFHLYVRRSQ
jgi:hypothetical protein